MATRSTIAMLDDNGHVRTVYCHWDGYPSNNGRILVEHYTNPVKITRLLELGDLSSLGAELGEQHDFDSRTSDSWCKFYGRDRGETGVSSVSFSTLDEAVMKTGNDYFYFFDQEENEWMVTSYEFENFIPVKDALKMEDMME